MSKIILPYQLRDGQKAYAARIMADLNALAGGLNNIRVEGLEGGDLETTLTALKNQVDQAVVANRLGNASQIRCEDGQSFQDKLDSGELNGKDGVVSTSDGLYYFYVGGDGHLYLVTRSQVQGEAFSINSQGHLIYTVDDPAPESGEPKTYDLGVVREPGDMQTLVYDPTGKRQDVFAYAEAQVAAVGKAVSKDAWVYGASWDSGTNQAAVTLEDLTTATNFYVGHSNGATMEQRAAWRNGAISVVGQTSGSFTLQADGALPTIDIPLTVVLLPS